MVMAEFGLSCHDSKHDGSARHAVQNRTSRYYTKAAAARSVPLELAPEHLVNCCWLPQVVNLFGDSKHPGMAYHSRPEEDPYITVHEDSDSEKDDFVLKSADRLILAARNEDDVSHLEVRLKPIPVYTCSESGVILALTFTDVSHETLGGRHSKRVSRQSGVPFPFQPCL